MVGGDGMDLVYNSSEPDFRIYLYETYYNSSKFPKC